ncbi:MAG: response regulator [Candidatus Margulisiibacteriota bacterium]|jgi:DNA-binding NtrC family response regulator
MKKPQILVVDDHSAVRAAIELILEDDYQIVQAVDAEEGWRVLHSKQLALVITDHSMPGRMNGLDMAVKLQQEHSLVPLILMSAEDDVADLARSYGIADFLPKPFDIETLQAKVKDKIGAGACAKNIH